MDPNKDPIRLLHLSDIHFQAGSTWDSKPVLRELTDWVGKEADKGMSPDLVVITGDLAFSGKTTDYELAQEWLDELWPRLTPGANALPRERLLLVPGNHDVDRDTVDLTEKSLQHTLLAATDQQTDITKILSDSRQRDILLRRHKDYLTFYSAWLGTEQILPWWQRTLSLQGRSLHIAGLDSAWMAYQKEERGKLLLGRYQVNQTANVAAVKQAYWRISLMHHPWDYLAEADGREAKQTLHHCSDLLLRGHLHQPLSEQIVPVDPKRGCLELATGCVYEQSDYPNAFQWIELYPVPRKVRVHYRLWDGQDWIEDRNFTKSSVAYKDYKLGPGEKIAVSAQATPPPVTALPRRPNSIHHAAVAAIAEHLGRLPELAKALIDSAALDARDRPSSDVKGLAEWLCAVDGDFLEAMKAFKSAVPKAAKPASGRVPDPGRLREVCRGVLGWLAVTAVMDGYDREDARLASRWFKGGVLSMRLGRSPGIEVLTACWLGKKAEFGSEPRRFDYGRDDITPKAMAEIGFDDPATAVDPGPTVDYVMRKVYQEIYGKSEPQPPLSAAKIDDLKGWLNTQLRDHQRRKRLVIDRADLESSFNIETVSQALATALPQLHLIFIDSREAAASDIFVVPAGDLNGTLLDALLTIENAL